MTLKQYYISERFFTAEELKEFEQKHGYKVTEIKYSSVKGEVDFSVSEEKEFLMKEGFPMILARFFA